jgi:hypothetical protein
MEGFADIEGPVRIGIWELVGMAALVILCMALLAGLITYLLRRKRNGESGPAVPERSPLEIALSRLTQLESSGRDLESDPFVVEVSDIVRDFLESSLEIPAKEQTSEEFLSALQQSGSLPDVLRAHMPPFLQQCDLVKFARQSLEGDQRLRLLSTAGTVVRETDADLHQPEDLTAQEVAK